MDMVQPDAGQSLDSVARHRRTPGVILRALFERRHYVAAANALAKVDAPVDFLKRYVTNGGTYPADITVRTPMGPITLATYSPDDVQTINEIFLRGDYDAPDDGQVVVDFGSNIGISAAFFLSRRADAVIYCHEPVPRNIERLKHNLAQFGSRVTLAETAVGLENGLVQFGWEPTGRYGGVGREVLAAIIAKHGRINTLKIDIETLEAAVTSRIPPELSDRIDNVVVEYPFETNPLSATHVMERRHFVTLFRHR
jgi:FkbM family methyltransferase